MASIQAVCENPNRFHTLRIRGPRRENAPRSNYLSFAAYDDGMRVQGQLYGIYANAAASLPLETHAAGARQRFIQPTADASHRARWG